MKKTRGRKSRSTVPLKEKNEDDNFKLHFNIVGQRALLVWGIQWYSFTGDPGPLYFYLLYGSAKSCSVGCIPNFWLYIGGAWSCTPWCWGPWAASSPSSGSASTSTSSVRQRSTTSGCSGGKDTGFEPETDVLAAYILCFSSSVLIHNEIELQVYAYWTGHS